MPSTPFDVVVETARAIPPVRSMPLGAFVEWLESVPEYWERFEQRSLELSEMNGRLSLYRVREDLRWDFGWGFSNNVTPYISRLLVALRPELADCIQIVETEQEQDPNFDLFDF